MWLIAFHISIGIDREIYKWRHLIENFFCLRIWRLTASVTPRFWPGGIDLEAVGFPGVVAHVSGGGDDAGGVALTCASIAGMTVASVWPS